MKCLWCNKETEGETFLYCSWYHKVNHRQWLDNPLYYMYPQEWEYSFEPLPEKETKDG